MSNSSRSSPPLLIVRAFVGPALVIAGLQLIPISFGLGVFVGYVGFAVALAESIWEPTILFWDYRLQVGLVGTVFILCGIFTISFARAYAPIGFSSLLFSRTSYEPGVGPGGIAWRSFYTELDLLVTNRSEDKNYDNVDIVVRPDLPVAAIAQLSNLADVSFEDEFGVRNEITMENDSHAPLGNMLFLATDAGYKVHCGHIPPNNSLKIVMAVVDFKSAHPNGQSIFPGNLSPEDVTLQQTFTDVNGTFTYWFGTPTNASLYMSRARPNKITVSGSYVASYRKCDVKQEIKVFSVTQ
jgi:hypothetical protein